VLVSSEPDSEAVVRIGDAEYPARQFVAPAIAVRAALAFHESGARLDGVRWE
jgi:hypothetical protein